MKAFHVTKKQNETYYIGGLSLPVVHRKGVADPEGYRRQARGEMPRADFNPNAASRLCTITLNDGKFAGFASQAGALLTFVISGDLTLTVGDSKTCQLEPGDIVLTDDESGAAAILDVRNGGMLVQIGVAPGWPGPDAQPYPGDIHNPPRRATPNLKRIYRADDDRAYYAGISEIFSAVPDQWSTPRPIEGFRMLRWEKGMMDMHPCVVNQLAIVSAGELEIEVGSGAIETFRAGDMCLAEDRTGEGHANRVHDASYVTIIVIATEHLWPR
jgi:mannose-6-phosphate isomerase-like protein (cupin superfamily)